MHSGFVTLRNDMSMDLLTRLPMPPIGEELAREHQPHLGDPA
jgi:hypothetical protein